jgi:hypothetical protein
VHGTPHQGRHVQDALALRKTPPTSKRLARVAAIREVRMHRYQAAEALWHLRQDTQAQ